MESIVSIIQSLYSSFRLEATVNNGDVAGVGISLLMIVCTAFIYFSKDEAAPRKEVTQEEVSQVEDEPKVVVEKPVVPEVSWKDRLTKGLSRSRTEVWGKLEKLFSKDTLDQDTLMRLKNFFIQLISVFKLLLKSLRHLRKDQSLQTSTALNLSLFSKLFSVRF